MRYLHRLGDFERNVNYLLLSDADAKFKVKAGAVSYVAGIPMWLRATSLHSIH
jgi:hypothetical protein